MVITAACRPMAAGSQAKIWCLLCEGGQSAEERRGTPRNAEGRAEGAALSDPQNTNLMFSSFFLKNFKCHSSCENIKAWKVTRPDEV